MALEDIRAGGGGVVKAPWLLLLLTNFCFFLHGLFSGNRAEGESCCPFPGISEGGCRAAGREPVSSAAGGAGVDGCSITTGFFIAARQNVNDVSTCRNI